CVRIACSNNAFENVASGAAFWRFFWRLLGGNARSCWEDVSSDRVVKGVERFRRFVGRWERDKASALGGRLTLGGLRRFRVVTRWPVGAEGPPAIASIKATVMVTKLQTAVKASAVGHC